MTTQFDHSDLKKAILEQFPSLKAFAEAMGMSASSLYNRMNNKVDFTLDEIQASMDLLHVDADKAWNLFCKI